MYFTKESRTPAIISPTHQILSQDQKYKLSSNIIGFLICVMTKYKTFCFFLSSKTRPQLDANKTNAVHSISAPVL